MRHASVGMGLGAIAVVGLRALSALGQQPPQPPRPVSEAVQVNVVNVEVSVTGLGGRPVFDLKREEFELREDGAIVPLTNFLAPPPPGAAARASALSVPPAAPAPAQGQRASDEESQRTLVVFVDDINLTPRSRKPVLDKLRGFLAERTHDGYRVLLLSFNGSLRQHTPLTADPKVLAGALETLRHTVSQGTMTKAQRDGILRDSGRPAAQESGPMGELERQMLATQAQYFALEQEQLNRDLLGALIKVVDSLAGFPGRKVVLCVSDGVPLEPGADVLAEVAGGEGATDPAGASMLRGKLRDVARRANANRITFYTINNNAGSGRDISSEIGWPSATDVDAINFFNRDPSLTALTVATGGLKLPNADALPAMVADLEASYSLGYSPSHYGDGKYHRLSVRVKRAGVSARFREGYLDKTPEQRQADRTTAALLAGGNTNPLDARVELGKPVKQGRNKVAVPLMLFIPAANLTLLEAGENHEGKVSIAIAVAGRDGRRSEVHRETFPIKVPSQHVAAFLKHDASFTFRLVVGPGDLTVSVTARDEVAQVESVVVTATPEAPDKS